MISIRLRNLNSLILVMLLAGVAFGQKSVPRQEYFVEGFTGGLNVVTDSIDLARNEMIQADNFTMDRFGALHKRFGIEAWNDSLLSADTIKFYHYAEQENGDKILFIATNNFIYELAGWTDTITTSTWAGYEIDYEIGKIDATSGQKYLYGDISAGDDMNWIPVADIGDIVIVGNDTLTIDSILTDTSLHVEEAVSTHSDASYRLLKSVIGDIRMTSSDGDLYVADSKSEPWWYDGTKPQLLGVIDEGNVTTAAIVDTTLVGYDDGVVRLERRSNIVQISGADISNAAFDAGNAFHAIYRETPTGGFTRSFTFTAIIRETAILSSDTVFYLDRTLSSWHDVNDENPPPDIIFLPDTTQNRSDRQWWITHKNIRVTTEQYKYIEDSTQIWGIDDYQGFWVINSKNALNRGYITTNTDNTISFNAPNTFSAGINVTPSSANDSYTYVDTVAFFGIPDATPTTWTSPGSGTDIAMVCDSMVKYVNDDVNLGDITATDSTTFYTLVASAGLPTTVSPDSAQDTSSISSGSGLSFVNGDKYYVAWQTPSMIQKVVNFDWYWYNLDSVFVNEIFFSDIYFHRNRLYAIGKEISRYTVEYDRWNVYTAGDTSSTARVWLADLGRPGYIPSDFNFDLSGANLSGQNLSLYSTDRAVRFFGLKDDLYVITNSNIYRISGEPVFGPEDLWLSQVIQGVGTNQPSGVITTKDNVAYIMNQQGIWLFNGNSIQKISFKIDPLVEKYRESRMVAGKFKDNLFFSYPDSDVTVVMHDPTKTFTLWTVGMLTINDQFVAIDSNYFLFSRVEDSAYVLKYPRDNTNYTDILMPGDTSIIVAHYKSGWQAKAMGTLRDKVVQDLEITAFNVGVSVPSGNYLSLNTDFTGSEWDSTAFAGGEPIHIFDNIGVRAKAFQVEVKDSTEHDFYLSNYLLRWYHGTGNR